MIFYVVRSRQMFGRLAFLDRGVADERPWLLWSWPWIMGVVTVKAREDKSRHGRSALIPNITLD